MTLSQIKNALETATAVNFQLPNGTVVPQHFHVTEVGLVSKHFIDCGGTVRTDKKVSFQLWEAGDYDHRVAPQKLLDIIALSEKSLGIDEQLDVEVEYQSDTIGRYAVDFDGKDFLLLPTKTACLAEAACNIPPKKKVAMAELQSQTSCCTPGGGCC